MGKKKPFKTLPWAFRAIDNNKNAGSGNQSNIYQAGPWRVDVRNSAVGEKIVLRSGEHELRRYLAFAEATGLFKNSDSNFISECIYAKKLNSILKSSQNILHDDGGFGWLCHMVIVRLPVINPTNNMGDSSSNKCNTKGGCLIYSPVLGPDNKIGSVCKLLAEHDLLPVRLVLAPTPQHHLAIVEYQKAFPNAFFLCGKASGQMNPLTKRRRDIRFDGVFRNQKMFGKIPPSGKMEPNDNLILTTNNAKSNGPTVVGTAENYETVVLEPPQLIGGIPQMNSRFVNAGSNREVDEYAANCKELWKNLLDLNIFDICIVDDNRTGEVVLLHKPSKTLIISDLLYKSDTAISGPGGAEHNYSWPEWFADGQQELFYTNQGCEDNLDKPDEGGLLLPHYRTHPCVRTVDVGGMRRALKTILSWDFDCVLACHTDPIEGKEGKQLINEAWNWVWNSDFNNKEV